MPTIGLYDVFLVGRVSKKFAKDNNITTTDTHGYFIVSTDYAKYCYLTEVTLIEASLPAGTNYSDLPVNPTTPIIH